MGLLARAVLALTVPPAMASQVGQWVAWKLMPAAPPAQASWIGALGGLVIGVALGVWLLRQTVRRGAPARGADLALALMSLTVLLRAALTLLRPLAFDDSAIAYACVLAGAAGIAAVGAALGDRA